jgi:hypothetical protein
MSVSSAKLHRHGPEVRGYRGCAPCSCSYVKRKTQNLKRLREPHQPSSLAAIVNPKPPLLQRFNLQQGPPILTIEHDGEVRSEPDQQ